MIFKQSYWGGRAATYFVDPNTLGIYLVALTLPGLFIKFPPNYRVLTWIVRATLTALVVIVIIRTETRTAWISASACIVVFLLVYPFKNRLHRVTYSLCICAAALITVTASGTITKRVESVVSDIQRFSQGDLSENSVGVRMGLVLLDIELVKIYPGFGIRDGSLPQLETLQDRNPAITKVILDAKLASGSHSEILGQLVRKGIFLGTLTVIALFLLPLVTFIKLWRANHQNDPLALIPLLVTVSLTISSLGLQVFNLKMTSTFWSVFLAIFYAYYCHSRAPEIASNSYRNNLI